MARKTALIGPYVLALIEDARVDLVGAALAVWGGGDVTLSSQTRHRSFHAPSMAPRSQSIAQGNISGEVYLIGLAEDVLPGFYSKQKGDRSPQFEEERRNCFVAVTRCLESLTLSYADRYSGWAKAPSRFLEEMGLVLPNPS